MNECSESFFSESWAVEQVINQQTIWNYCPKIHFLNFIQKYNMTIAEQNLLNWY